MADEETAPLVPSASWYLWRVLGAARDGSALYGGPARSLALLQPLRDPAGALQPLQHRLHLLPRAHADRVNCVDLSEDWPTKRKFLTGSTDGYVKYWNVENTDDLTKVQPISAHNVHAQDKEEVVGVGFSGEDFAITVGSFGVIVKWDLMSNVTRTYNSFLKHFKPICMSCSPHAHLTVAIGTKQGVLFVIDLKDKGSILYKVRGHDNEISGLSWCPQQEVVVKKALKFNVTSRLDRIRNEVNPNTIDTEPENEILFEQDSGKEHVIKDNKKESLNGSTVSNNEGKDELSIAEADDDMFDIYQDHEHDEFGHKKFQPENISVPVEKPKDETDFLAECIKLKKDIINLKNKPEESIHELVKSLEEAAISDPSQKVAAKENLNGATNTEAAPLEAENSVSSAIHRHLLVSIEKFGKVCVWSKSGKLLATLAVPVTRNKQNKAMGAVGAVHWYRADVLLLADGRNNLLQCNPLQIDSTSKIEWKIVHSLHKRVIFCIASAAPKKQSADTEYEDYPIWTTSQDRKMVLYSLRDRKPVQVYETLGGFVYMIAPCPYDAQKLAIAAGDGAIRVWEMGWDGIKLTTGLVTSYWQNVQGKVMTASWHRTKENILAFGTAEGRVGLLDINSGHARVLRTALSKGVYTVSWGENNELFACGDGELVVYNSTKADAVPGVMDVVFEGKKWTPSEAVWYERGLCVGSKDGEVGVLRPQAPYVPVAAAFIFQKSVHCIAWHPQSVSLGEEESPYKNWIAASSTEKYFVVLELLEEDGSFKLGQVAKLSGHTGPLTKLVWSPHRNEQILSTSIDATVRVWNVKDGTCTSVFDGHVFNSLTAVWCPQPSLADFVISGGGDYCLRKWNINNYPSENATTKKKSKPEKSILMAIPEDNKENAKTKQENGNQHTEELDNQQMAVSGKTKQKSDYCYVFPMSQRQQIKGGMNGCRKMLENHLIKNNMEGKLDLTVCVENGANVDEDKRWQYDIDFIKIFGSTDEFNELLDLEQERHLSADNVDHWIVLGLLRGEAEKVFQKAASKNMLSSFLLSIAPMVSHKFWKDAMQSYIVQSDRLLAEGNLYDGNFHFGGHTLRKVITLMSLHNVLGAVNTLLEANLYREAYVLARVRHMESVATDVLEKWAVWSSNNGSREIAVICYIALGKLVEASTLLGKSKHEKHLCFAAEIAKITGQDTYADSLIKKVDEVKITEEKTATEELLSTLPERLALHLQARAAELGNVNENEVKVEEEVLVAVESQ